MRIVVGISKRSTLHKVLEIIIFGWTENFITQVNDMLCSISYFYFSNDKTNVCLSTCVVCGFCFEHDIFLAWPEKCESGEEYGCWRLIGKDLEVDAVARHFEPYLTTGCVCTAVPLWCGLGRCS